MSSLINQQDGCLQTVARQASLGRISPEGIGTIGSNEFTEFAIPRQRSSSIFKHSSGSPRCPVGIHQIRTKYSFYPRMRITCSHASTQQRSERLEIQSGQPSGTSTIQRNPQKQHRSTRSHGQTVSSPMETSRSTKLKLARVQQCSSTATCRNFY